MSLSIDAAKCQGHGRCTLVSPDLFDVGDDGFGVVLIPDPGSEYDDDVETAIGSCPEQAISRGLPMLDLRVDVTGDSESTEPPAMAVSLLPELDRLPDRPIVLFTYPGGGYSRGYLYIDHPGLPGYSEAIHHSDRELIVVAADHLGVGDSAQPGDRSQLTHEAVAKANDFVARAVLTRLVGGALAPDFPAIPEPIAIGLGHSLGGCVLTVQQARHRTFDAVALLG